MSSIVVALARWMSSCGLRVDREGHVLDARRALGRGDDDFLFALPDRRRSGWRIAGLRLLPPPPSAPRPARPMRRRWSRAAGYAGLWTRRAWKFPFVEGRSRRESDQSRAGRKGKWRRGANSCDACCTLVTIVTQAKGSSDGSAMAARRTPRSARKAMADDLRLLLQPVAVERPARHQLIGIAAEGVAHQRQIKRPRVCVCQTWVISWMSRPCSASGAAREIVRPARVGGVEMDVAGRRHDDARAAGTATICRGRCRTRS